MNTENNDQRQAGPQSQDNNRDLSNTIKDPDQWTTGNEPMTGAQQSYLKTLSDEAGEELNTNLSKADASKKIDELQHKTGRGLDQKGSNESESDRANKNEDQGIRGGQSSM